MNPEELNKQTNATTVGGVKFGRGNASTNNPGQPINLATQVNTQAVKNELDEVIKTTGAEFDAVMTGGLASQQNYNQAPMASRLNVPVASPTHFDIQNTVNPAVADPRELGVSTQKDQNGDEQKTVEKLGKKVRKLSVLTVMFGVLTMAASIAAVVCVMLYANENEAHSKTKSALKDATNVVRAVEEATGVKISKPEDVPIYKATTGYIYLSTWGIKIKIPDSLEKVSYILNENYRQSICFNAVGKGVQYFPDFANIALNPGRMGCLTRIPTAEGEFDAATGISFGKKVFTHKNYSYFYTDFIPFSKDQANLGLETTAAQYIKNMLTDNISQYE